MARGRVRIRGARRLKRSLEKYTKKVRMEAGFEQERVAFEIQDAARRIVPVDTGNLQSSISVSQDIRDELVYYVGSSLEYAAIIEFGYSDTQQVQAHRRTITQAFGEELDQPMIVSVEAHTRRVDREGNFYLTKAAQQAQQTYRKRIRDAIQRASP
jgi:phage gpG-like protein